MLKIRESVTARLCLIKHEFNLCPGEPFLHIHIHHISIPIPLYIHTVKLEIFTVSVYFHLNGIIERHHRTRKISVRVTGRIQLLFQPCFPGENAIFI